MTPPTPAPEPTALLEKMAEVLKSLKRKHYECDDCWYSCPKSGECCNEGPDKDYCDCGADEQNKIIDEALAAYEKAKPHA